MVGGINFSLTDKPGAIAQKIAQIKHSGVLNLKVKAATLYPITRALLDLPPAKAKLVAEELANIGASGDYRAIWVDLVSSAQKVALFCPVDVFNPNNHWSWYYRQGIGKRNNDNKAICIVGPGTGVEAIELLNIASPPQKIFLIEQNSHALDVARLNIAIYCRDIITKSKIELEYYCHDVARLFPWLIKNRPTGIFDAIYGCLPQVPSGNMDLKAEQNIAHHYNDSLYNKYQEWGLGLLYEVVKHGKRLCRPGGKIVLAHSGRVPESVRQKFYQELGMSHSILQEAIIPHCPTTSLTYLFGQKDSRLLFTDSNGSNPISPEEAEIIRQRAIAKNSECSECGIFHSLVIIESTPIVSAD